jgi:hypothetical protein
MEKKEKTEFIYSFICTMVSCAVICTMMILFA